MAMDAGRPPKKTKVSRSTSEQATIVRAKAVLDALPPLLGGIAEADVDAAKVRIDQAWLDELTGLVGEAESAADGRSARMSQLAHATRTERGIATELVAALGSLRDRIETHHPDDEPLQRAFGYGARMNAGSTGPTLALAGAALAAWDAHRSAAQAAGVTEEGMSAIASLRGSLSSADVAQSKLFTANRDGTVNKEALFALIRERSAYAVKVVGSVFGRASSAARSIADRRPRLGANAAKAGQKARRAATKKAVTGRKAQLGRRKKRADEKAAAKKPAKRKKRGLA